MKVYENRVLRGTFGLKRDEMMGGWRKLHNEELHNMYSPPSIIKTIKSSRTGYIARMEEKRHAYRLLWKSKK
jgi:hypothetical protein